MLFYLLYQSHNTHEGVLYWDYRDLSWFTANTCCIAILFVIPKRKKKKNYSVSGANLAASHHTGVEEKKYSRRTPRNSDLSCFFARKEVFPSTLSVMKARVQQSLKTRFFHSVFSTECDLLHPGVIQTDSTKPQNVTLSQEIIPGFHSHFNFVLYMGVK